MTPMPNTPRIARPVRDFFWFAGLVLALVFLASCAEKPVKPAAPGVAVKGAPLRSRPESPLEDSPRARDLRAKIEAVLAEAKLNGTKVGVYVQSLDADRTLVRLGAHEPFVPASTMKLFTTAAALHLLSPGFRFQTVLAATGPASGGVLPGDLYLLGGGDPSLGAVSSGGFSLTSLAEAIKAKGITTVAGSLIGDDSRFARFGLYPGWTPDDEQKVYAAPSGGLSLNQNCVGVVVTPGKKTGERAGVELVPPASSLAVDNTAVTGSAAKRQANPPRVSRRPGTSVIEVRGVFPIRSESRDFLLPVDDPAAFTASALAEELARAGIAVRGGVKVNREASSLPARRDTLYAAISPELRELIRVVNKKSNNFYAEQLLLGIGLAEKGFGSRENGAESVARFALSLGVPSGELGVIDGSGLSRLDAASPYALIAVLRAMYDSPYRDDYLSSLPVAGQDGTLQRRMRGGPAEGRVVAKTGTMRGVSSLAGYVTSQAGGAFAFAVMLNGPGASNGQGRAVQDQICALLAQLPAK